LTIRALKLVTGSKSLDSLLHGGISTSCITDVFGAAGTGKTQFAFQNAMLVASRSLDEYDGNKPSVVFVDCAGSFRPERIAEMADERRIFPHDTKSSTIDRLLSRISSVYVRTVSEQQIAIEQLVSSSTFSKCRLLIVDDVSTNFADLTAEENENENGLTDATLRQLKPDFVSKHYESSRFFRKLALFALKANASVLLTNSVRSRIRENEYDVAESQSAVSEVETIGGISSQFALFRVHFSKFGNARRAKLENPLHASSMVQFRIVREGITP
jgi:RecA/RadA recombinase